MQMRKSKADQTVQGICIILSNILSKRTAFLHQGVTSSVTTCTELSLKKIYWCNKSLDSGFYQLCAFEHRKTVKQTATTDEISNIPFLGPNLTLSKSNNVRTGFMDRLL